MITIKDMEMPESCYDCDLNNYHFCDITGRMRMSKNEEFVLTEWGCLYGVLTEYDIDVSHITARVGTHIVEDFMDAMCKAGYVKKKGNEDE